MGAMRQTHERGVKMKGIIKRLRIFLEKTVCFIQSIVKTAKSIYNTAPLSTSYRDLAPTSSAKDFKEHIKALYWAITNPRIKNIALTGPYGSGKSSVIQTFLNENKYIASKSIQISLASFSDERQPKPLDVEEGILKQLFYKVEQKDIPQSRYRKIRTLRYWPTFGLTLFLAAFSGLFAYILFPQPFVFSYARVIETGNQVHMPEWLSLILFCLMLIGALALVVYIIQTCLSRFTIKDIKLVKETTTVTNLPQDSQILNKKIDEIVYFFEKTSFRIVFFEDLDRFQDSEIYVKLREINTLLNNYDAIKDPIVFVYAIKDDIFTSTDRTKFFDFIIPVIPIVNSTNSAEIFLELLNVENDKALEHNISKAYILDIAPFISEMRVIYNIYNEFLLYKQTIKTAQGLSPLKDENLMSLIVFKNLYPDQFALLQNEKGLVKEAFMLKRSFVNLQAIKTSIEIARLTETLEKIDSTVLKSQNELKCAMLSSITNWKGMATSVSKNGTVISALSILQNDFDFTKLLQEGQWTVSYYTFNGTRSQTTLTNFHEICTLYNERLELLALDSKENIQRIKEEIAWLESESADINTWSLQKLMSRYSPKRIFEPENTETNDTETQETKEKVCDNQLLIFMLRKGYINEEYANYINFFKGKSMTISDKNFILSVKTQKPEEFTYKLSPPTIKYVISSLQPYEFSERAVLNFDLLDYMLCSNEYDKQLEIFIRQLTKESSDTREFINHFIDRTQNQRRFVKMLAAEWPAFWESIYDNHALTDARKRQFLFWCCGYLSIETLRTLNASGKLSRFIIEDELVLHEVPENVIGKLQDIIAAFGIRFPKVRTTGVSIALLDFIFDNCYYEINFDTIFSIVESKNSTLCDRLATQTYTTIKALSYQTLLTYVHDNFEVFVKEVTLRKDNTEEDTSAVSEMLERCIDNLELCESIITHNQFTVDSVATICQNYIADKGIQVQAIWDMILQHNRLALSWKAIYDYWNAFKLTPELCKYIENNSTALSKQSASCLTDEFKESIILSEIDFDAFARILSKVRMTDFSIRVNAISEDKLALMVQRRSFSFSVVDYEDLEEYKPELCVDFICLNQQDFIEHINEITISDQVFEQLICSDMLKPTTKLKVVEHYGLTLMTPKTANHLCSTTLAISREVFARIWACVDDVEKKYRLMVQHLDVLGKDDFEKYLIELGNPYQKLKRSASRHEEFIPDTQDNRSLVGRLTQVQYLTSYEFEKHPVLDPRKEIAVIRCRVKAKT